MRTFPAGEAVEPKLFKSVVAGTALKFVGKIENADSILEVDFRATDRAGE